MHTRLTCRCLARLMFIVFIILVQHDCMLAFSWGWWEWHFCIIDLMSINTFYDNSTTISRNIWGLTLSSQMITKVTVIYCLSTTDGLSKFNSNSSDQTPFVAVIFETEIRATKSIFSTAKYLHVSINHGRKCWCVSMKKWITVKVPFISWSQIKARPARPCGVRAASPWIFLAGVVM